MSSEDGREMPDLIERMDNRLDQLEKQAERSDVDSAARAASQIENDVEELLNNLQTVEDSFQNYDESMRENVTEWKDRLEDALEDIDSRADVDIQYDSLIDADINVRLNEGESTYSVVFANAADSENKTRRDYLRDIGLGFGGLGVLTFGLSEAYDSLTSGEQPSTSNGGNGDGAQAPSEYDVNAGETYSWAEFNQCLTEDQESRIEESLDNPSNFEYEPQIDGELDDVNIMEDGEVIGYLDNEDLACEVKR